MQRWVVGAALLLMPAAGAAQPAVPTEMAEVDPIKCWWRTGTAAVRVGEVLTIGLTCAVLETESVQVVPDESQLSETAIQLNPFEIVSGSHPPDIRSGSRRFFQYLYQVRALNPDTIGQDVSLPPLVIPEFPEPVEVLGEVISPIGDIGPMPLVLFLHGRHSTCYRGGPDGVASGDWPCPAGWRPVPSQTGYRYMTEILASQGYLTVSIAANGINAQDGLFMDGGAFARGLADAQAG